VDPSVDLAKREKNKKRARELLDKIKKQLASTPNTPDPIGPPPNKPNPNSPINPNDLPSPHDPRDRFEEPLPGSQDQISAIKNMQRELKAAGADLGTFGPNGDGIDGKIGNKTGLAMRLYPKIAAKYADNLTGVTQYNNPTGPRPQNRKKPTAQTAPNAPNPVPPQPSPNDEQRRREELFRMATGNQSAQDVVNQAGIRPSAQRESLEDDRILNQIRNMRF
jgi:hypothetical protein